MAKKKAATSAPATVVSADRVRRLVRLLRLLEAGPQTRTNLTKKLRLAMRGFYRDLVFLRAAGIELLLKDSKYHLQEDAQQAIEKLPFPDPNLTIGEAQQLSRAAVKNSRKLRELLEVIL